MIRQQARERVPIDLVLFSATVMLVVIGLWMVFDSSYAKSLDSARLGHDAFFFLKKQAGGAVIGVLALCAMMRIGYHRIYHAAVPMMAASILLLCAVWIPHVGIRENNASRWLNLGIRFQPSEVAKLGLIVYVARNLSGRHVKVTELWTGLLPPIFVTAVCVGLIEREPDLGTAAVLFLAVLTQLLVAGARKRHLILVVTVALALVAIIGLGKGVAGSGYHHRMERILAFLHPNWDKEGAGYQAYHTRLAVGSGEWTGTGPGQGKEKFYMPQANTDFIMATLAEEAGFAGCLVVLVLMAVVGWRGMRIARLAPDRFGMLLAAGITALISWQALVNIAVATDSIPATGVPLPFISFGSSSLVFLMASIGVLINIAQHSASSPQDRD